MHLPSYQFAVPVSPVLVTMTSLSLTADNSNKEPKQFVKGTTK